MRFQFLAITCITWIALSYGPVGLAEVGEKIDNDTHNFIDAPQEFVVCTGWHALCTASPDCKMNGDTADCDCMRVNEPHILATSEIQDTAVKRLTLAECTNEHPCDVDQAPVCNIQYGQYTVDDVKYKWVSTYSYRGWCSIMTVKFIPCDQKAKGSTGDLYYAICVAARRAST